MTKWEASCDSGCSRQTHTRISCRYPFTLNGCHSQCPSPSLQGQRDVSTNKNWCVPGLAPAVPTLETNLNLSQRETIDETALTWPLKSYTDSWFTPIPSGHNFYDLDHFWIKWQYIIDTELLVSRYFWSRLCVLTFSRSVPVACWLAASWADSLCGWTMWNRDTRLTASWGLETNKTTRTHFSHKLFASRYSGWCDNSV